MLVGIKYYLAAAYWALEQQRRGRMPRDPALKPAKSAVARRVSGWSGFPGREQSILLAAHLVRSAMPREWKALRLGDPVAAPHGTAIDSFYRHHILPTLPQVKLAPILFFPH